MATVDGSDEFQPDSEIKIACDACLVDGLTYTAEGFCVDCNDYLCMPCIDVHRRQRFFRTHQIKQGDEMPRSKPTAARSHVASKCGVHAKNPITAICKSHDQLCCDLCVTLGHNVCADVMSIRDVSKAFIRSEHYKTTKEKLKNIQITYTENMKAAKVNLIEADVYYTNAIEKLKAKVDKIKQADTNKLNAIIDTYDHVLSQFNSLVDGIDAHEDAEDMAELFILDWRTQHEIKQVETDVNKLCSDDSIVRYEFRPDTSSLGRLVEIPYIIDTANIKHSKDTKQCLITDMGILNENLMIVTDYNNASLKIFNTDSTTLVSYLKLRKQPWQMAVTEQGEAYVTLHGQPKILHLKSPATDITKFREIHVGGKCYAVECFNNTLKVQCLSPAKLIEVHGEGNQVRVINKDLSNETTENGEAFVTSPSWSTQDPATGSMYVSCNTKHSITEITRDGNVKLVVKADKLNAPYGLCMDTDGSMLVCSYGKDVFRVKKNGDIQSILPQPLDFIPRAVALDKRTQKLYIGGASDKLHVFQI